MSRDERHARLACLRWGLSPDAPVWGYWQMHPQQTPRWIRRPRWHWYVGARVAEREDMA